MARGYLYAFINSQLTYDEDGDCTYIYVDLLLKSSYQEKQGKQKKATKSRAKTKKSRSTQNWWDLHCKSN